MGGVGGRRGLYRVGSDGDCEYGSESSRWRWRCKGEKGKKV